MKIRTANYDDLEEIKALCARNGLNIKKINQKIWKELPAIKEFENIPIGWVMESDNKIAACQPKVLSYNNKKMFEYAGASGGFLDKLGYPFCRGRIFETIEKDDGQYDNKTQVFWASGCCFMIRSDVFHKYGGFDKYFFAHMEEIDLCWRINNLGFKIYCEPKSVVYHMGSQTLNEKNPKKTYLNFRNNLIMILKNDSILNVLWKLPIRILLDLLASIKFFIDKKSLSHTSSILKAYINFCITFPLHFVKRYKHNKKSIGLYNTIIPIRYYVLKVKKYCDL